MFLLVSEEESQDIAECAVMLAVILVTVAGEIDWPKYEYCLFQRRQYAAVGQENAGAVGSAGWFRRRLGQSDQWSSRVSPGKNHKAADMQLLAKSLLREPHYLVCAQYLDTLFKNYPSRDFQVRFWDDDIWGAEKQPHFTLILKHARALRAMFSSPSELTLGEAYIHDDFDIEGDIEAAFDLADYLLDQKQSLGQSFDLNEKLHKLSKRDHPRAGLHLVELGGEVHSKERNRQAIRYHYDLPAEFYALWLDPRMVYSCAYFATPDQDLDSAQEQKLDYICRKLRLHRGERLLDIGCGWGALIIHAAAHYGVEAVGITLSVPQAEVARERVREAGVNDRCRVEVSDYRDIDQESQYDKIVSVGMFEHVGEAFLPEYFHQAWNLLRPGGVFLNHGISYSATHRRRGPSFVDRYVFPGGELVPISTSLRAAELSGFEVRDVESLREHYALTLHHWVRRLENHADEARRITSDTTYRIWRLFMAGAAHGFRSGRLNVYQALLAKPLGGLSGLPLTRADWYFQGSRRLVEELEVQAEEVIRADRESPC